jgi:hypothetical protein
MLGAKDAKKRKGVKSQFPKGSRSQRSPDSANHIRAQPDYDMRLGTSASSPSSCRAISHRSPFVVLWFKYVLPELIPVVRMPTVSHPL